MKCNKKMFEKVSSSFIIWMLDKKPNTGYSIHSKLNDSNIKISYSQLYPFLNKMNEKGYLKKKMEKTGKRKKYRYYVTPKGKKLLKDVKNKLPPLKREFIAYLLE